MTQQDSRREEGYRWSARCQSSVLERGGRGGAGGIVWGGKQQDVPPRCAGGVGCRYDDNLMVFTEINAAIIQERLKISQQVL